MSRKYSLAYLTIPGTTPTEQIRIAAEAGYDCVSLRTIPMHLPGEPIFQFEKDKALFESVKKALADYGILYNDMELARVREDLDVREYEPAFEKSAELGARNVLSSVWTEDKAYREDTFGLICDMAAKYDMTVNLEFMSLSGVRDLKTALELRDAVARKNIKIVVDLLYVLRSQIPAEELALLSEDDVGFIHLCDGPAEMPSLCVDDAFKIVREGRLYLGEGDIDIKAILKALPKVPFSIELPNAAEMTSRGAAGHAARCLETAKACLKANGID